MSYVQYLEEIEYSLSAQYDRFDGFDRGDTGRNQEYEPTVEEQEADIKAWIASGADIGPPAPSGADLGPVRPLDDMDIPF